MTAEPVIISAAFVPNPATAGRTLLLRVVAADLSGTPQDAVYIAGEWQSGEVSG